MADFELKINEEYAKNYLEKKQEEELSMLKEKYAGAEEVDELKLLRAAGRQKRQGVIGSNVLDYLSDSEYYSSSSEEDEVGELATPQIDVQIFKTISAIRQKDKSIYNKQANFFNEQEIKQAEKKWKEKQIELKNNKPITMKEYQNKILLEDGGIVNEEEEIHKTLKTMTHTEEQQLIKDSFKNALQEDDDDNSGGLFLKKDKTNDEVEAENDHYKEFLLENLAKGKDSEKSVEELNFFKDAMENPDQAFLVNYILNRGWMEKDGKKPKYETIINDEVDALEEYDAETFESEYSHRFQESGGTTIQTYSRIIDDSVRKEDNKRKNKRKEISERKKLEKEQKIEELKRLKNLKRAEIEQKLEKIKEITGNSTVGFGDIDLDADYDPENYDKQMSTLFNENYYEQTDSKKPKWDDDIDIADIYYNNYDENTSHVNEDLQVDEGTIKKSKKELESAIDDLYKLNYEDIIGDLPTRFKYQTSKPLDFGLTPEEILLADEKDLNEYDLGRSNRKKSLKSLKKKIQKRSSIWEESFKSQSGKKEGSGKKHK
ncbi:hypothetical protein BB559_001235 [Furculomyces boomerangus]|uniref:Kri1-like C-terminal domain-containing protein n=1 Tax=Furculomyces boomerangus TaxID=61424 RepID=A0A2T9Z2Q3_9FUNG|nr:hypothetical protein BB559_001235 [Furculomyces boomerangus]